ncbi:MAG: LPS export ABC transporter periplasmic protein LptC [Candidatus Omnitrophica bacterium]|nr:LPS export ABC transporter periplasmic protein LptC [Candidatus Omnitrophota bacterium]
MKKYFLNFLIILFISANAVYSQQKIKDFYLSNYKEDGSRDWEITGKEAKVGEKYVDIDNMNATYYSADKVIIIKSDKATIDKESMNATLKDNIEAKIPTKDATDYTTITCDGPLEMEYENGKAVFYNNVVVENRQGKLFCDKATVFFDKDEKKIIKIIAEGNVKIIQEQNVTVAQKATYLVEQKLLIFEGRPNVIYFPKEKPNQ